MLLSPAMQAIEDRGCDPACELWVGIRVINHSDHLFVIFASNASLPVSALCEMWVRRKSLFCRRKELRAHTPHLAKSFESTGNLFFNWINF